MNSPPNTFHASNVAWQDHSVEDTLFFKICLQDMVLHKSKQSIFSRYHAMKRIWILLKTEPIMAPIMAQERFQRKKNLQFKNG